MKIMEIMTPDPVCLTMESTLRQAAELVKKYQIDGAPVVDSSKRPVGIVTRGDLNDAFIEGADPLSPVSVLPYKELIVASVEDEIALDWSSPVGRLPVVDQEGKIAGIVTRTDMGRALLALVTEETRELKGIFDSTRNGFITVDKELKIARINASAMSMLGLTEDVVGQDSMKLLPLLEFNRIIIQGMSLTSEKLQYGNKLFVCDRMPMAYEGEVWGGIAILQDISGFQAVIDELEIVKGLTEQLDAVIESSYDGIYITDGNANTLRVNRSYERITGVRRDELIGRNMYDLVQEGYISKSVTLLVLQEKKAVTIEQKVKTGKHILVTGNPIIDEKGIIQMVVTNVRDITELTQLKEELEKNKELKDQYYQQLENIKMQIIDTSEMIARDVKMKQVISLAQRISPVNTTVILLGETGVGKEELARFIHKHSLRCDGPFIKINCGAIPENLLESELFGYEKGAFTGASNQGKQGLFEVATGGTLLLDEIAELPLDMQVKLLRALQEKEVKRVGGIKSIHIDVRIIAATNRNLVEMVKERKFREDLYYRLNVVPITIPPLRERRADILPLIFHFLQEYNERYGWQKTISPGAVKSLYEYHWPGNVRELKNIVERVVVMSEGGEITEENLPDYVYREHRAGEYVIMPLKTAVDNLEAEMLEQAFRHYKNVRAAAHALGIDASTFVRKRQRLTSKNRMPKD